LAVKDLALIGKLIEKGKDNEKIKKIMENIKNNKC